MRILLINDSTSNPNWGDRAASLMLQKMIKAKGCEITQRITEYQLGSGSFLRPHGDHADPTRHHHHWLELALPPAIWELKTKLRTNLGASRSNKAVPERVDQFDALCREIVKKPELYSRLTASIENSDLAVIHGNGCMVGSGTLPRAILFLAYLLKQEFSRPVILINHTATFDHPDLLAMATRVYPLLDDVVYRDQTSNRMWSERWHGRYAADSAFLLEPAPKERWLPIAGRLGYFDVWPDSARFEPGQPYICLGGSSLYSQQVQPWRLIDSFTSLIEQMQRQFSHQIVLTASDGRDQWIFRPLAERLQLPLVSLMTPVLQAVDILGNAVAYVGGRWHASIFALRGGTPVIPLTAKSFKMDALATMAALPVAPIDALELASHKHDICQKLTLVMDQGEELRERLRNWSQEQANLSWGNIAFLANGP